MYALYELFEDAGTFFPKLDFYKYTIMYMQEDAGNDQSECMVTFDEWIDLYNTVEADTSSYADYQAEQQEKGLGEGTEYGWYVANAQRYMDVVIYSVNVFNYCSLSNYLIAFSKSLGSRSGQTALAINLMFRFFSSSDMLNYYNLSVAVIEDDVPAAGQSFGTFLSLLFAIEVPEVVEAPSYQPVGTLQN